MQGAGHNQAPEQQTKTAYVSSLTKPVHKPVSGRGAVLPRAMSGPRRPTGQPVNRNLPFAKQEMLQAQTPNPLQNTPTAQNAPADAGPVSAGSGQESLNVLATRQNAAQLTPGARVPGLNLTDKAKAGG